MKEAKHNLSILGYDVFSGDLNAIDLSRKTVINTINPHSYCVAEQDEQFKSALTASDVLLPDGIGIVLAGKLLKGKRIKKIAGADLHRICLRKAEDAKLKVFYLGASQATLDKIHEKLKNEFSNVKCNSYSPPYKVMFSEEESLAMVSEVNAFAPDYLFVGMTAPKQEKWVHEYKSQLNANVICSIGAVFDFYSGTIKRPHPFWIKIGLEWLVRFVKEPRRLAERNLFSMPRFIWVVLKAKVTGKH